MCEEDLTPEESIGYGICKEEDCKYYNKKVPYELWQPGDGVWMCPGCGYAIGLMKRREACQ